MTTTPIDAKVETPTEEKAVETPAEETSVSEASTEKETVSEETLEVSETPEKAQKPSETEDLAEEETKQLSVKAQKRFADLSKKANRADELEKEIETLRESQEGEFTSGLASETEAVSQDPQAPPQLPWEEDLKKGEPAEVTQEDYKRDVLTTADWIVRARLGQARRIDSKVSEIKSDLTAIQHKYEALNPDSEKYDKELSTKLAGLFGNQIKANPKARLTDFVGTVMDVRQGGKEEGKAETSATLVDQKAEEALTPSDETGTEVVEKPFEELDLDGQEKYLKDHGLWE